MFRQYLLVTALVTSLAGCGGEQAVVVNQTVPQLNALTMALTPLAKTSTTTFEQHLKNGLFLRADQHDSYVTVAEPTQADPAINGSSTTNSRFSSTITQEIGVDEGDRIKYDGHYLFIASDHYYPDEPVLDPASEPRPQTSIRIMARDSVGSLSQVNDIVVDEVATSINSIYLNDGTLSVISQHFSDSYHTLIYDPFFPVEQSFNVAVVDVHEVASGTIVQSLTIDGTVIDSRRVNNMLYVISSYAPHLAGIAYTADAAQRLANYNKIQQTNINELLPHFTDANGQTQSLVAAENCYLPQNATDKDGFDGIVTLTAIDLTDPQQLQSVCVNTQVSGIYATATSIYLYGTDYQYENEQAKETSIIHKFSVNGLHINYNASGTLNGRFNWNFSNLRFSEQGDYLRVVTTAGNRVTGFDHRLNVLTQADNELMLVAQLPNDTNTRVIGKTNDQGVVQEDIKAVRFFGDSAYVVTFLTTDPLYVLDLSNPLKPLITGELTIPGYSAYLQPLSANLLLGIGQNIDASRFPENADTGTGNDTPVVEGAKVTLFDVSQPELPTEVTSLVFEDGYTPVEYDYHALTYLHVGEGKHRFALPIERWWSTTVVDEESGQKTDVWHAQNTLELLEVSASNAAATLSHIGSIEAIDNQEPEYYIGGWQDRAVFHDNDIYYLHGNQVWRSYWDDPANSSGPF